MDYMQYIQETNYEIKPIDAENVRLTLVLPSAHLVAFMRIIDGLGNLFFLMNRSFRTDIDLIHARIQEKQRDIDLRNTEYEALVCRLFQEYCESGTSPREALSLVTSRVSEKYSFSSYSIVKDVLTKSKLLKKTGYYKSRHKFDT